MKGSYVPDFAIVGAPKCGTTSLYEALEKHPEVCMSYIKEPQFYATDLAKAREVSDAETYARLFRRKKHAKVRGESSTLYLYSHDAIPAMIAQRPDLKVVAMVRNPIDLYQSLHNELLKERNEEEENPEIAWALQSRRLQGYDIPRRCREPRLLHYRDTCSLGEQVQRLFEVVPPQQRMILAFDDLVSRPTECMRALCRFLGVSDQLPLKVPWTNAFARSRSRLMSDVLRIAHTNPVLNRIQIWAKPTLNRFGITPIEWLLQLSLKKIPKPPLSPHFRATLSAEFAGDVALLESLLNRSFTHWLGSSSTREAQAIGAAGAMLDESSEPPSQQASTDGHLSWHKPLLLLALSSAFNDPRIVDLALGSEAPQSLIAAALRVI